MEKIKWSYKVTNEKVLERTGEKTAFINISWVENLNALVIL